MSNSLAWMQGAGWKFLELLSSPGGLTFCSEQRLGRARQAEGREEHLLEGVGGGGWNCSPAALGPAASSSSSSGREAGSQGSRNPAPHPHPGACGGCISLGPGNGTRAGAPVGAGPDAGVKRTRRRAGGDRPRGAARSTALSPEAQLLAAPGWGYAQWPLVLYESRLSPSLHLLFQNVHDFPPESRVRSSPGFPIRAGTPSPRLPGWCHSVPRVLWVTARHSAALQGGQPIPLTSGCLAAPHPTQTPNSSQVWGMATGRRRERA